MKNILWISWQNHRRTQELSKALGIPLIVENSLLPKGLSYFHRAFLVIVDLLRKKPDVLIVQNPSVVLAFLASIVRFLLKYKLVVDRHTNFRIGKRTGLNPAIIAYMYFSSFSIKHADLTIVTNNFLKKFVDTRGGKGFVLKDKLPSIDKKKKVKLKGDYNVVFICTYANDEPYNDVIRAAEYLPESISIYITGSYNGKVKNLKIPDNVVLTGYLPQSDYDSLLNSAQVILDFTNLEWCLVCGGYEAIALGKPFITSNTVALKELFGDSALYARHDPLDIARNIKIALRKGELLEKRMENFKKNFETRWQKDFKILKAIIETF